MNKKISTLEILKKFFRDHCMLKKAVENITKLRTQSKGNSLKNVLPQKGMWTKLSSRDTTTFKQCSDI